MFPSRGGTPVNAASPSALFRRLGDRRDAAWSAVEFPGLVRRDRRSPRSGRGSALAHVVPGVEGAYARSDLLDRRRVVMEAWGRYLI